MDDDFEKCVQYIEEKYHRELIWTLIGMTIFTLTFFMLVYITVRVTALVYKTDKVLPGMLVCLCLSLLCGIGYYYTELRSFQTHRFCVTDHRSACVDNFLPILSEFFLSIAITLNVAKWLYFLFRIRTSIKIERK